MPLDKKAAADLIVKRHPEWCEHQRHWRWMADSLEGGNRYRMADYTADPTAVPKNPRAPGLGLYGTDPTTSLGYDIAYGQLVDRNLIPHLSETGTDGRHVYTMRLARTPVPAVVERTVESHLSRIYSREVTRKGPAPLLEWHEDVDGKGTSIDRFMLETAAPLLTVLGQLDLCFDHPEAPEGLEILTKADQRRAGVDACVMSVILPENLVWWKLDPRGARYAECLVFERCDDGTSHYRHWTDTESNAYDCDGEFLPEKSRPHPFGVVPVVRVFDRRKPRCKNVGRSRYESIAWLQKAIYNARSELILGDVLGSHPRLQMPEDYLQKDAAVPIGPDRILPMKALKSNGQTSGYQGSNYIDTPKGAQAEVRTHVLDWQDEADRDGALSKPAGLVSGTTTGQSGLSKQHDQIDGNATLSRVADVLAGAELAAARMALRVLGDGQPSDADLAAIEVSYPKQFDLFTAGDLAQALDDMERITASVGALPGAQSELLKRLVAIALPGIPDEDLKALHAEVDAHVAAMAAAPPAPEPTPVDPNPNA